MLTQLEAQGYQPDRTKGHVQTVGADQREERAQERAALWTRAFVDQVQELIQLQVQEGQAEGAGDQQPDDGWPSGFYAARQSSRNRR